jgi:hypothetical protein
MLGWIAFFINCGIIFELICNEFNWNQTLLLWVFLFLILLLNGPSFTLWAFFSGKSVGKCLLIFSVAILLMEGSSGSSNNYWRKDLRDRPIIIDFTLLDEMYFKTCLESRNFETTHPKKSMIAIIEIFKIQQLNLNSWVNKVTLNFNYLNNIFLEQKKYVCSSFEIYRYFLS